MSVITLEPESLSADQFAPFGDVIELSDDFQIINRGTTHKCADLARIDVDAENGKPCVSLYRAKPYDMPITVSMLERHPLSSQLFMPIGGASFLVIVAPPGGRIETSTVRVFLTNGRQGVNYRPGTWHHPVIALVEETEFFVVDRVGAGKNCDVFSFDQQITVIDVI